MIVGVTIVQVVWIFHDGTSEVWGRVLRLEIQARPNRNLACGIQTFQIVSNTDSSILVDSL